MTDQLTGVYIHIPFCLRKCLYCDFYSVELADKPADDYTGAVVRAIESHPFGSIKADTLYFGGGTPSLLGPKRLERILSVAVKAFSLGEGSEITLEANPASVTEDDLFGLREMGFNRLSVGVQSLEDSELAVLGRLHNADDAVKTVIAAAKAGFEHISADVMLAIPGQTQESLASTIDRLAALPVDHISAYLLKIEEGTAFYAQKNALALPDEDEAADLYLACVEQLERHGFLQYEISNFARAGGQSRHNLKYWRCCEYLGIGSAAHSLIDGRRFYFPHDANAFMSADEPFALTVPDGVGGSPEEKAMLALRLAEGFAPETVFEPEAAARMLETAAKLATRGLARIEGGSIRLTTEGFLVSNSVIASLIGACEL